MPPIPEDINTEQLSSVESSLEDLNSVQIQTLINEKARQMTLLEVQEVEEIQNLHKKAQQEYLYLRVKEEEDGTTNKSTIEASLIPIVMSEESERLIKERTQGIALARMALLTAIYGNEELGIDQYKGLKEYLVDGIKFSKDEEVNHRQIAVMKELMSAGFDPKNPARWRADSFTDPHSNSHYWYIEMNGGEPQGDVIIAQAAKLAERSWEVAFGIEQGRVDFGPYPDEQMMDYMTVHWKYLSQENEAPNIGFLSWEGRSSLSEDEAQQTAKKYKERTGKEAVQISPLDLTDIEFDEERGTYTFVAEKNGKTYRIDIIRRLHAEPMENMDLWERLKEEKPDIYYKLAGIAHHEYNPDGRINPARQMVNGLNSWATDKKLDAILQSSELCTRLELREKLTTLLGDPEIKRLWGLGDLTDDQIDEHVERIFGDILPESIPETVPLNQNFAAFFGPDISYEEKYKEIADNRDEWVIKLGTLVGHSGAGVFVGKDYPLSELPPVLVSEFIEENNQYDIETDENGFISNEADLKGYPELYNLLWAKLVDYARQQGDAIAMKRAEQVKTSAMFFDASNCTFGDIINTNVDLNPQQINGRVSRVIGRGSPGSRTNITGHHGGLVTPISMSQAKKLLAAIIQDKEEIVKVLGNAA